MEVDLGTPPRHNIELSLQYLTRESCQRPSKKDPSKILKGGSSSTKI